MHLISRIQMRLFSILLLPATLAGPQIALAYITPEEVLLQQQAEFYPVAPPAGGSSSSAAPLHPSAPLPVSPNSWSGPAAAEARRQQRIAELTMPSGLHPGAPLYPRRPPLAPTGAGTFAALGAIGIAVTWTLRRALRAQKKR